MIKPESIFFDMDGTLWDGVSTYVLSWNETFIELNIDKTLSREDIFSYMGMEEKEYLDNVLPEYSEEEQKDIYEMSIIKQKELILERGGVLYNYVKIGIKKLYEKYPLFIVSNCPKDIIRSFLKWSDMETLFKDYIAHGDNYQSKSENIKMLMQKHSLNSAVYVGDTESDYRFASEAGIDYIHMTYGFGNAKHYSMSFDNFKDFTDYFINL